MIVTRLCPILIYSNHGPKESFRNLVLKNSSSGLVNVAWGPVRGGLYARHYQRWRNHFPPSSIHIVSGEKLVSDPAQEMAAVQVCLICSKFPKKVTFNEIFFIIERHQIFTKFKVALFFWPSHCFLVAKNLRVSEGTYKHFECMTASWLSAEAIACKFSQSRYFVQARAIGVCRLFLDFLIPSRSSIL